MPPERDAEIADEPAIHPNCAGVDPLGDAMGAAQVLRPDARREAVFDVIGVIDHFFFAVEGRDCYNGAEISSRFVRHETDRPVMTVGWKNNLRDNVR